MSELEPDLQRRHAQRASCAALVGNVAAFARALRVGDPLDPNTQLGPVVLAE